MNDESCDLHTDIEALQNCFAKLSHDDQRILRLHYYDGLSAAQIAVVLDITRSAVLVRLHRARQRLRRLLEENQTCLAA
jgi:RNA polymerase sigma-70 factor (ECF subfamily)